MRASSVERCQTLVLAAEMVNDRWKMQRKWRNDGNKWRYWSWSSVLTVKQS